MIRAENAQIMSNTLPSDMTKLPLPEAGANQSRAFSVFRLFIITIVTQKNTIPYTVVIGAASPTWKSVAPAMELRSRAEGILTMMADVTPCMSTGNVCPVPLRRPMLAKR